MGRSMRIAIVLLALAVLLGTAAFRRVRANAAAPGGAKSILVVYHGGQVSGRASAPLEQEDVDALTHATSRNINVEVVAGKIRDRLTADGCRVKLLKATDVRGPNEFLDYDGIIFGTPTWFSNVAYPVKELFDEHLIRIYAHREGRLNDKALTGFVTVMERGKSGPRCLQCLTWGLEHLSGRLPEGLVVNVFDDQETVNARVVEFCERFAQALAE